MLIYTPEPIAAQRARWPLALARVVVYSVNVTGGPPLNFVPGESAANVFDSEDGIRIVASVDRMPDGSCYLHVSGSFKPQSPAWLDVMRHMERSELAGRRRGVQLLEQRMKEIAVDLPKMDAPIFGGRSIPHWYSSKPIPDPEETTQ